MCFIPVSFLVAEKLPFPFRLWRHLPLANIITHLFAEDAFNNFSGAGGVGFALGLFHHLPDKKCQ